MKFEPKNPPRSFRVGRGAVIEIADCGRLQLDPDEQITFTTPGGAEYDVARKSWGFYATPSTNGRLAQFGLRAALVRNAADRFYLFLVERGHEAQFETYLAIEEQTVVAWLDSDAACARLSAALGAEATAPRCLCGGADLRTVFHYDAPPPGETAFPLGTVYARDVRRCTACGHYVAVHGLDLDRLYDGGYVGATYGDDGGIGRAFDRITSLPPGKSDNAARVRRVTAYADAHLAAPAGGRTVLDVGSGLGVFVNGMKQAGWVCTALDPDARSARHAREVVGVDAVHGDYRTVTLGRRFDAVTFNKVLEHVADPVSLLARAKDHLADGGFIYVELPDGEAAEPHGPGREEFFVDHLHVFSAASIGILAQRAGLAVQCLARLQEPSTKFTLYAFATVRE